MSVEQWEKDLRKQLLGVKREQWEDDLLEEIGELPSKENKNNKNNTTIFIACLIVLGILTTFVYDQKTATISKWWRSKHQNVAVVQPLPSTPQKSYDQDIDELRSTIKKAQTDVLAQQAQLSKLELKTKFNSDRITLVGMILNENFTIMRNNYDKNHLIFFNRDWTLDQMPHYLQLSEDDRNYLKKYVKTTNQ